MNLPHFCEDDIYNDYTKTPKKILEKWMLKLKNSKVPHEFGVSSFSMQKLEANMQDLEVKRQGH